MSWAYQPVTPASPLLLPPPIPGIGPAGAATFVLELEGAKVTYSWKTDIEPSWSGLEKRICRRGAQLLDPDRR